jgi:hypothetical protein
MQAVRMQSAYSIRYGCCAVVLSFIGNAILAQDFGSRELVLGERTVAKAQLLELEDNSRLRFNVENNPTSISFGEICRFGAHPLPQRFPIAILVDGSCIAVTSIERNKDQFVLQTNTWENIHVPESLLRAIIVAPPASSESWYSLVDRVCNATGRNDQLLLGTRGWTEGILQWPETNAEILQPDGSQKVRINNEEAILPVKDIEALVLSPILTPMSNLKSEGRIGWKDGTVLVCSQWRVAQPGDYFELTLRCGISLKSLDQPPLVVKSMISLSNRPQEIRFLSDIEAASYKHVDWLTSTWPLAKDRDLLGRRLMTVYGSNDRGVVEKGLAMHATSQAAYRWDKSSARLLSSVVLASPAESGLSSPGQAIAKVMGLKGGKLEPLYTSPLINAQSPPQDISIPLEGVELIVLIVDAGPGGTLGDHVLWLDARIQK